MPVETIRYASGELYSQTHREDGKIHRLDGPAVIHYRGNGAIELELWYQNGRRHRTDGPAFIDYTTHGVPRREVYYLNGEIHREDGPAFIWRQENGLIIDWELHKNGIELNKSAFKGTVDPDTGRVLDQASFDLIFNVL